MRFFEILVVAYFFWATLYVTYLTRSKLGRFYNHISVL